MVSRGEKLCLAIYNNYYNFFRKGKRAHEIGPQEVLRVSSIVGIIPHDVKTLLDIGCGDGALANPLLERYKVVGVDVSMEALAHVNTPKIQCSVDNLPFKKNCFDLVMCTDVLEHLPRELIHPAIKEVTRAARCYILINVPNEENLEIYQTRCPHCGNTFHVNWHVNSFSKEDIQKYFIGAYLIKFTDVGRKKRYQLNRLLRWTRRWGNRYYPLQDTVCPMCGSVFEKGTQKFRGNPLGVALVALNRLIGFLIGMVKPGERAELIFLFEKR